MQLFYDSPRLLAAMDKLTPDILRIPHEGEPIADTIVTVSGDYSGGTAAYTASPNAEIILAFAGNRIEWHGYRGTHYGIADVYIDGQFMDRVSLYAEATVRNQLLYESPPLAEGEHELRIAANYEQDKAAGRYYGLNVDFFRYDNAHSLVTIEEGDGRIRYIHPNHYYYLYYLTRKLFHAAFYGLLTLAFLMLVMPRKGQAWIAMGLASLAAIIDEIAQMFVSGRHPSWIDLIIDGTGIIGAMIVIQLVHRLRRGLFR
jgi:VanZ family protein